MGIIYMCKNILSNRVYIGKTIRKLSERSREHLKELRNGSKHGLWQEDYHMYGEDSFVFTILESNLLGIDLSVRERELITTLNTLEPNGYNKSVSSGPTNLDYSKMSGYSIDSLVQAVGMALSTDRFFSVKEIADIARLSESSVEDLLRIKSFKWISNYCPEDYSELVRIHSLGIPRKVYYIKNSLIEACRQLILGKDSHISIAKSTSITIHQLRALFNGKAYVWLQHMEPELYQSMRNVKNTSSKDFNDIIRIYDSIEDITLEFSNKNSCALALNIDRRRVSDLYTGTIKTLCNGRYILA